MEVITILNDLETYTSLDGSKVLVLSDKAFAAAENRGNMVGHAVRVYELNNPAHLRALADALEASERG